jgi:cytidylate kinase
MDILLMGPPGAGKGTQGAILGQALGLPKFATGDLLRDAVKRGTPLGRKAKAVVGSSMTESPSCACDTKMPLSKAITNASSSVCDNLNRLIVMETSPKC